LCGLLQFYAKTVSQLMTAEVGEPHFVITIFGAMVWEG
jgi:hypothetical protein